MKLYTGPRRRTTTRKVVGPEALLSREVKKFLRFVGFTVTSTEQKRRSTVTPGTPDLYLQGHGIRVWVELKAEDGRLSDDQNEWHRVELENGGTVLVWRSVTDAVEWWNLLHGGR